MTLAALALAQPALTLRSAPDRVFVIDASASMAARGDGGETRLERALSEVDALLGGAGRVAVVRAGLGATVALPLTDDRAALREVLGGLEAADASSRPHTRPRTRPRGRARRRGAPFYRQSPARFGSGQSSRT